MPLTPHRRPSSGQRRCSVGGGVRHSGDAPSGSYTYRGRRLDDGLGRPGTDPIAPRRQSRALGCSENHGVKAPTPEQYLTPLQQKEVCIRHLRARLREHVQKLQHRDSEIDELRAQLSRMQDDWIEEECQRVEAQLALKDARREIQQLQEAAGSARDPPHDPPRGAPAAAGGRSRSCGCSPAGTLSRGGAHRTRRSSEALHPEAGGGGAARQTHLLLEAALLSEQPPSRGPAPPSPAYERVCCGGAVLPVSHSCHALAAAGGCSGLTRLPHHHVFLHLPQEEPCSPAPSGPAPTAGPPVGAGPELHTRACSPPALSIISAPPVAPPPQHWRSAETLLPNHPAPPFTRQPRPATQEATPPRRGEEEEEREGDGSAPPPPCHWSSYFLVDLLALAAPVVPAVAWLCGGGPGGGPRDVLPPYHLGSLLRGCCAVALHSLRRRGTGAGHRDENGAPPPGAAP